jgi:hypothetical protein
VYDTTPHQQPSLPSSLFNSGATATATTAPTRPYSEYTHRDRAPADIPSIRLAPPVQHRAPSPSSPLLETDPELAHALRDSVYIGSGGGGGGGGSRLSHHQQQQHQFDDVDSDMPAVVRHAHSQSSPDVGVGGGAGSRSQPRSNLASANGNANPFEGGEEENGTQQPARVKFGRAVTR